MARSKLEKTRRPGAAPNYKIPPGNPQQRSLRALSEEGLGAILPLADHWSTRGDASWRRAPWRQAIRPPLHWGCSNGGTADREVPGVLSDDLARGYHNLRLRASRPSQLSSPSCSERRGTHTPLHLLSGPPGRRVHFVAQEDSTCERSPHLTSASALIRARGVTRT